VEFSITLHSGGAGVARPADALDLLWQRLGAHREEVSFAKVGHEIRAKASKDPPVSTTWDERAEICRRVVLDIVRGVCEQAAELEWDWFAVSSGE
jgi:hypothetical protein